MGMSHGYGAWVGLDRVDGDEIAATQEHVAHLLGVRREGVTEGARRLQALGLIRCARGRILVLDRAGLAKHTCECYEVLRQEYERLLPEAVECGRRPAAAIAHVASISASGYNAATREHAAASNGHYRPGRGDAAGAAERGLHRRAAGAQPSPIVAVG
jgi:hypothetical protein